ncbi:MAG: hypothetical protein IJW99_04295 [Clostridia bacterium]|nr:hypothetical protein [Clostridia bacterium]
MKSNVLRRLACILSLCLLLSSCSPDRERYSSESKSWYMGFGASEIALPEDSAEPLYIAGYQNGEEIEGVLDLPRASAVWMDTGERGVLLIGIDCVGLGRDTVGEIRERLKRFCRQTGCVSVNVYATHTHAGVDTLGLWGPVAIDGKNTDYMENLIRAAVRAAERAYADRTAGSLYYGSTELGELLYDSREPAEFDPTLHQLRFVSEDETNHGIRLISYAAHAESLRGDNRLLSRDFPGAVADGVTAQCGDDTMYLPGAIGGLIMTRELVEPFDAEANMRKTAERITSAVMSIRDETALDPNLAVSHVPVTLPLDNTFFFFAKFLGILGNETTRGKSDTGYLIHSELGVLSLGSVTVALIPGEIFPELVSGRGLGEGDPKALAQIAAEHGVERLLILGLCNDELGYIVPPSAILLNDELPYIEGAIDESGENHYEETNSVGIKTAEILASAFAQALRQLQQEH